MKRKILGIAAIVLAVSLSAFNAAPNGKSYFAYWWFPLNIGTGTPGTVTNLVYQSFDPYSCYNWAWGGYCSGGFNSYGGTFGSYYAAGDEILLDYHLPP
ncbi:MAG TPA: hypothetical protein VGM30_23915 [Puia sp.]|jgi:hypothetical protein